MQGRKRWFLLSAMIILSLVSGIQNTAAQTVDNVEGNMMFEIQGLEQTTYQFSLEVIEALTNIVDVSCTSCTVSVLLNDEVTNGQQQIFESDENTSALLTIESHERQLIQVKIFLNVSHHGLTTRPSPTQTVDMQNLPLCDIQSVCFQHEPQSLRNTQFFNQQEVEIHAGKIADGLDDYLVFPAAKGATIELNWHHLTGDQTTTVYFQEDENELQLLPPTLVQPNQMLKPLGILHNTMYLQIPDDGRIIVKIQGENPTDYYALSLVAYRKMANITTTFDVEESTNYIGHGIHQLAFDWPEAHAILFVNGPHQVELNITFFAGVELRDDGQVILPYEQVKIYPYPNTTAGKFIIISNQTYSFDIELTNYSDASSNRDAQGYLPSGNLSQISQDWVLLNVTENYNAQLTLSIFDTSDTYLFYIEGWEESIHFVEFKIEGTIGGLQVQLWDMNPNTHEPINSYIGLKSSTEIRVGQQVGQGHHILQIRHQDPLNVTPTEFGMETPPIQYTITSTYQLIDEGEEPWFPPDDEAKAWGEIVRWILGFLLIVPAIFLFIAKKRNDRLTAEILSKRNRLDWLKSQLDSGNVTSNGSRKNLLRSLTALQSVAWNEGTSSWGPPSLQHTTEGLEFMVWELDKRLSTDEKATPYLIGVYAKEGSWDLAVLKIEAPEGSPFNIVNCAPKFLFRGEEVFIDTLLHGQLTYFQIDVLGSSKRVEFELNGRLDGQPFAAKIPHSLLFEEE